MSSQQGVSVASMQSYLRQRNLALIVGHNVTTRDRADRQQPFNLRVAGTSTQTIGAGGKIYDVSHLQIFQGDQIRGIGGTTSPRQGRRVLAQLLHDPAVSNPPAAGAPPASVAVAADGSIAAFVPARRALSWQLTGAAGVPVVRERYWVTMQPGEVRVCASCHAANTLTQAGGPAPVNEPEALRQLLAYWKAATGSTPPTIASGPSNVTVPPGQAAVLSVTATGGVPLAYQWYTGTSGTTSNAISGATASAYTTAPLTSPARSWVRVSNATGSADSGTAVVSVSFTDGSLTAGVTPFAPLTYRATHANRCRAGALWLDGYAWTDPRLWPQA